MSKRKYLMFHFKIITNNCSYAWMDNKTGLKL
jgi:hypothetical protein